MQALHLEIDGMSCGHCVARVARTLGALDGVSAPEVGIGSARLQFDPDRVSPERIAEALRDAGYPARTIETRPA